MEWVSDRFDFTDPLVRLEYVSRSVGGCISMLCKSWSAYKIARREGYVDRCLELEYRINCILQYQAALPVHLARVNHLTLNIVDAEVIAVPLPRRRLWLPSALHVVIASKMYAQLACELWIFLIITSVNITYG